MDRLAEPRRRALMAKVKAKDTHPERVVRSALHREGFRFRLHYRQLPGTPDIVFPKLRKVIFIHGCFWHGHEGCNQGRVAKDNQTFWQTKRDRNQERDRNVVAELEQLGWQVHVVWTCSLRSTRKRSEAIANAVAFLRS